MRPLQVPRYGPAKTTRLSKGQAHGKNSRRYFSEDSQPFFTSTPLAKTRRRGLLKQASQHFRSREPKVSIIRAALAIEAVVTKDLRDVKRYPEVAHVADVRRGLALCQQEQEYLALRKESVREAFANYMGVELATVHADDVPIIAFGGSGGGLRAMIAVLGFCNEMKKAGMWDTLTYVAGVSGSCWSLAAYYTFGGASMTKVIEHCRRRFSPHHPLSYRAIRKLLTTGAYATLGPLIQKRLSGLNTVTMDLYSVLTTGYLFLHDDPTLIPGGPGRQTKKEVAGYHREWYKWSNAMLNAGREPLPILTAVRHERPWQGEGVMQDPWFQWFEMTPFEIGCDELEAWVPTWGFGRPFSGGKSEMQLPEQSLALLLGLCTSAPAAHWKSYLDTIERNLSRGFFGNSIRSLARRIGWLWGKRRLQLFQMHHPIHACNEHNFMYQLTKGDALHPSDESAPSITEFPRLHLIDGGVDNNCPTYVLLHPSRDVDVIITFDASSDVQRDNFQARIDQVGSRRMMQFNKRNRPLNSGAVEPIASSSHKYAQIYDGTMMEHRPETVIDSYGHEVTNPPAPACKNDCTMVYMPLLPNENAVKGFNPATTKFSGSYNLVWTPPQVDSLTQVAAANFREGEMTIKAAIKDAWLKKKSQREARERSLIEEKSM